MRAKPGGLVPLDVSPSRMSYIRPLRDATDGVEPDGVIIHSEYGDESDRAGDARAARPSVDAVPRRAGAGVRIGDGRADDARRSERPPVAPNRTLVSSPNNSAKMHTWQAEANNGTRRWFVRSSRDSPGYVVVLPSMAAEQDSEAAGGRAACQDAGIALPRLRSTAGHTLRREGRRALQSHLETIRARGVAGIQESS